MNSGLSRLLLALMLSAPLVGCAGEGVTSYSAPSDADPGTGPVRLRGAIIPVGEDTWFIKLTGRNEDLEPAVKAFDEVIASLQFPEQKKAGELSMTWAVPKGWKEDKTRDPRKMDRVATLTPQGEAKPEITITKLGESAAVIKPNVDRWRRNDLGLIPITPRAMEKVVREQIVLNHKVTIVDMRGPGGQVVSAPPMPGHPPMGGRPPMARERPPQGKSPLKYKVPEGWKEMPNTSGIVAATLQVSEGAESARLVVTPLSSAMSFDLPANVNRWRGDVGLPPLSAAEVGKLSFPTIQVAGIEARTIDLEGKDKRSLVVWFDRGGKRWFFKFIGPTKLVGSQKAKFEEFMKSVQFPGGAE